MAKLGVSSPQSVSTVATAGSGFALIRSKGGLAGTRSGCGSRAAPWAERHAAAVGIVEMAMT